MSGLLMPVQYGAPSTSYQDDESLCSSRQGLIRSQRSSTVSSTTPEERTALKRDAENPYQAARFTTIRLSLKRLLLVSFALIALLVLSSLFTAILMHTLSSTTCTSISCVSAAETLRKKSAATATKNHSVSPCDDFYEYACSGWEQNTIYRAEASPEWSIAFETYFQSIDKITNLFNRLMSSPTLAENLTKYQKEALITYTMCIGESIEDATEALRLVYQEFGGWLSTAIDERSIEETLLGSYRSNAISLFQITALLDARDAQRRTVLTIEEAVPYTGRNFIYGGAESFDVEHLLSGRMDKHWVKTLLFDAGRELGRQLEMHETANFREALAQAILFDYKLARCSPDFDMDRNGPPAQWRTTVGELAAFEKLFNFRYFLEIFIERDIPARTEIVIGPGRTYFMRVMTLLREYSTPEGQKIIRDYIKFKQLFMLSIHSGKLTQTKGLSGLETLRMIYTGEQDRGLQCIRRVGVVNQLGIISLLERFWAPQLTENLKQANNIAEALRREYISVLRKSAVIDEIDRAAMIDKAERIRIRVAVPEASHYVDSLERESNMTGNNSYLWAIYFTTAMGNKHWQEINGFGKPADENEWPHDTNPFNTNVHYNYESNSILFPIIWSYEQYLDSRLPSLFSFAGFGYILGHEMTHAFDYRGRNFGSSGVDQNLTVGKTTKHFEAKQQCFQEQYTALGEVRITNDVLSENLADNVALHLSYKAWKAQDELKKRLPGVDLTSEQAFFTAYAQNWCSVTKGATGTHSVGRLRVLGPLQNSHEFAQAFACPAGSPMNPAKKCSLW